MVAPARTACLLLALQAFAAVAAADAGIEALQRAELRNVIRPIGVDGQGPWNAKSQFFLYPPTFGFPAVEGAASYRFVVLDDRHERHAFEAGSPNASLAPVWERLPTGFVTVRVAALDASGREVGTAGERTFWKSAPFRPGAYRRPPRTYAAAEALLLNGLYESKKASTLRETGDIDRTYAHNCYPSKMLTATIAAMVRYARTRPDRKDGAVRTACAAADWLIAHSATDGTPLAGMPPTYDYHQEVKGTQPADISLQNSGISMNIYPAEAALQYLSLHRLSGDGKYLAAAKKIGDAFVRLQEQDGTWPLKQRFDDGKAVGENRLQPAGNALPMLEALYGATGEAAYRKAADRAFGFIERGPLREWTWEAQFEDSNPGAKWFNPTLHGAASTALHLLRRFPGDPRRLAQARELARWCEDQFVFWEKPYGGSRRPREGCVGGASLLAGKWVDTGMWRLPGVTEQYTWYLPIDGSAAKMSRLYRALYRAEGNPLDLAKARALADSIVCEQRADGTIQTHWTDLVFDWLNCMVGAGLEVGELGDELSSAGNGEREGVTR